MAKVSIVLLLFVVAAVKCGQVIFEDCGSSYDLDTVHISGCERSVPCFLTVGDVVNVTATFKPSFVSTSLNQEAHVILNSVQVETDVSPSACEATWCPVQVQSSVTYEAKMTLPTNIAMNARGRLTWQVYNEKASKVLCFSVVVQTQSSIAKQIQSFKK